jgi:LPS-assembly protein
MMHFRFYSVFFLALSLLPLPTRAAEPSTPASPASLAAPESEKTVYIEAQEIESKKGAGMEAHGNVELQQGDQKVFADHLYFEQDTGDLSANGTVRVEQPSGMMAGPDLKMNMHTNIGEMNHPVFQLNPIITGKNTQAAARGTAEVLRSTGKLTYEYDNATYTTCPAGSDDWMLNMSSLEIDRGTQIGTAHSAWVEFKGVPLLYTPWMNFPLDGRRLSGFLGPTYGTTSSSGIEFTLPIYLNLAPNYDATISPRTMSKRGTLLNNEFRFMGSSYAGELHYDFLKGDRITNTDRNSRSFKYSQNLGGGFGFKTNLNRVSDDAYFSDLSNTVYSGTQTQLLNEGVLSYGGGWWSALVRGQTYQTLQNPAGDVAIPYQRLPQINLSAQKNAGNSTISMVNEYVDFRHPTLVNGQRLVLYPSITYNLLNDPGYYLKPKLGVNHTQYAMGYNNSSDIPDTTRTLPIFSVDSGMIFERGTALGDNEYVQTFEPRLFYVKIPYQNQDILPVYDTSQAPFNFAQMFTENRFIGNDRISDSNMATLSLTSRMIDNEGGTERLRVAIGERFSFQTPQVNLPTSTSSTTTTSSVPSASNILLAVGGRVTNALTLDGLLEYNPSLAQAQSYNGTARYKPEIGKVLNLGYRYTYVDGLPANDIRQADFSAQWPLFWHWNAVSRLSYSLGNQSVTEELAGLEYNRACWMLRLVAQKFPIPGQKVSTGVFIQLELRDLVALGSDPLNALRLAVPGYSKLGRPAADEATPGLP